MTLARSLACVALIPASFNAAADSLSGDILLGWRDVSTSGSDNKYRQHLNLTDGGRLLGLRLDYERDDAEGASPDRINIDLRNLGGDPFESMHIGVRKLGRYNFRYDRRKSEYFYNDLLIDPGDVSVSASNAGDFHHFDFERVQDNVKLDLQLNSRASANLGFSRYTREGNSTTTRDIQRDEFELEQPIDELNQIITLGFQYRWDKVTLAVEERFREFDSQAMAFLPGFSTGENTGDTTTLDFYLFGQPYGYDSNETQIRLSGRPTDRFDWRLAATLLDLDFDLQANESAQGVDFLGVPFAIDATGAGSISREVALYDLESSYVLGERISAVMAVRQQRMDQNGASTMGMELGRGDWEVDTTDLELGLQYAASPRLTISAGLAEQRRDVDVLQEAQSMTAIDSVDTDRTGFFATVNYRPSENFVFNARVNSNRIDDPLSLASPTDAIRYRMRGRYRFSNGVALTATFKVNDLENDNSAWTARTQQADVRLTYNAERVQLSAGISNIDQERDVEQLVTGGGRQDLFSIAYRGDTVLADGQISYQVTESTTIGGSLLYYDNDGSFSSDRQDNNLFVEYQLPKNYRMRIAYRNVDYNEDLEDYDADIVELAFGLGF